MDVLQLLIDALIFLLHAAHVYRPTPHGKPVCAAGTDLASPTTTRWWKFIILKGNSTYLQKKGMPATP